MIRTILVIAADAAYFDYARQLLDSLKDRHAIVGFCDLGFYDLGLDQGQREALVNYYGARVVEPGWDIPFPLLEQYSHERPWFRAMAARPFLPEYFPGYDCYIWLDADTWVQDGRALDELVTAAESKGCAAVPEIDRSYKKFREEPLLWELERKCYRESFSEELAARLDYRPQINTGVLAIMSGSPIWESWRAYLSSGLKDSPNRVVEQLAFNLAVYSDNPPIALLPSRYNWIAGMAFPAYDLLRRLFIEPQPPYDPIRIMHLTVPMMGHFARVELVSAGRGAGKELWTCLEYDLVRNRVARG